MIFIYKNVVDHVKRNKFYPRNFLIRYFSSLKTEKFNTMFFTYISMTTYKGHIHGILKKRHDIFQEL